MKKLIASLALTASLLTPAIAATVTVAPGLGNASGGGAFTASVDVNNDTVIDLQFLTFCLEKNENLSYGPTYNVTVSLTAMFGGSNIIDPISKATAWLYDDFLTNFVGTYDTAAACNAVQEAIWWFEQEIGIGDHSDKGALTAAAEALVDDAIAALGLPSYLLDSVGEAGVIVMNLTQNQQPRQDLLVRPPGPDTFTVPDGASTISLLGFGLLGLAAIRRRLA